MKAIYFKILQRRSKFRNPRHLLDIPDDFIYSKEEFEGAQAYLSDLKNKNIYFTYPSCSSYPKEFYKMKEPPLFIEYVGEPIWLQKKFISVVGSRDISELSQSWIKKNLSVFLNNENVGTISGGAFGVDQFVHMTSLKHNAATIIILPSGVNNLYPKNLNEFKKYLQTHKICFLSEFENNQSIHKSHFYFRNRLIAALGQMTLVVQASLKSGSLLTVHHCLENGRPVLAIPSHPEILGFDGNIKLLQEGAVSISSESDLRDFWNAEMWSS